MVNKFKTEQCSALNITTEVQNYTGIPFVSFVLTDVYIKISKALSIYIVELVELAVARIFFFLKNNSFQTQ